MKKSKVLILGGTYFVGWYLAERFAEEGFETFTLNRGTRKNIHKGLVLEIFADRTQLLSMKEALKGLEFDYIIDVSGYNKRDAEITCQVLSGHRFRKYIFISSSAVYIPSKILPISEDFPTGHNPFWKQYGTNKLEAEELLFNKFKSEGFPVTVLRPPYLYGEGNNVYREAFIFDRLDNNRPVLIPDKGETTVQFQHIEDLFSCIKAVLDEKQCEGHAYNTGDKDKISFKTWVECCMEAYGKKTEIIPFDYLSNGYQCRDFFPFYDYPYCLDISKMDFYHKSAIKMVKGLNRALRWYKNSGDWVVKKAIYSENSDKILKNLSSQVPIIDPVDPEF